jgi:ribonuclease E
MPSHARHVQQFKESNVPIFHHFQVESQLDAMHSPVVQLKSGGYIVLNQTEALVAIDVNSGRATRERHIEVTALKTNLEAAEEVARQLRLRDLAGLVVVDFIDMEESRHNRDVERRLKEAMRSDRARIQLGRVSPFGLLELSRQRLRPSLVESSTVICPRCGGNGHVRSIYSSALGVLRALEEEGLKARDAEIRATVPTAVALHLLNELRGRLIEIEQRYGFRVTVATDDGLVNEVYRLERATPLPAGEAETERADDDGGRKRRRRGRRRRGADEEADEPVRYAADEESPSEEMEAAEEAGADGEDGKKGRRRRGKRGGRRRSRRRGEGQGEAGAPEEAEVREASEAEESAAPDEADDAAPEENEAAEQPRPRRQRRQRQRPAAKAAAAPSDDAQAEPETDEGPADGADFADAGEEAQADEGPGNKPAQRARKPGEGSRRRRRPATAKASDGDDNAAEAPAAQDARAGAKASGGERSEQAPDGDGDGGLPAAAAPEGDRFGDGPDERHAELRIEPRVEPHGESPVESRGERHEDGAGMGSGAASGEHGEDDDPDQPKRRGWWQRWV